LQTSPKNQLRLEAKESNCPIDDPFILSENAISDHEAPQAPGSMVKLISPSSETPCSSPLSPLKLRPRRRIISHIPGTQQDGSPVRGRSSSQNIDRYIPSWKPTIERCNSFHMSKSVDRLTSCEKATRDSNSGPDPFARRLRNFAPRIRQHHLASLQSPSNSDSTQSRSGSPRTPLPTSVTANRQVSEGAVWRVGGSGASIEGSVRGVEDGYGGRLGSGTNAPLYKSNFLTANDCGYDTETYERRLALAMDVGQAERILANRLLPPVSSYPLRPFPLRASRNLPPNETYTPPLERTSWIDGVWRREECLPS